LKAKIKEPQITYEELIAKVNTYQRVSKLTFVPDPNLLKFLIKAYEKKMAYKDVIDLASQAGFRKLSKGSIYKIIKNYAPKILRKHSV